MHSLRLAGRLALLCALLVVAGCTATPAAAPTTAAATIIDVRTPAEFAEGHLQTAVNINLQGPSFTDDIAALPKDAEYVVYCRSGNRSAQAVAIMQQAGFSSVQDAGGIDAASSATGLPIVT